MAIFKRILEIVAGTNYVLLDGLFGTASQVNRLTQAETTNYVRKRPSIFKILYTPNTSQQVSGARDKTIIYNSRSQSSLKLQNRRG